MLEFLFYGTFPDVYKLLELMDAFYDVAIYGSD